jgi:hypothetical protein
MNLGKNYINVGENWILEITMADFGFTPPIFWKVID